MKYWTSKELLDLREMYPVAPRELLEARFQRTWRSIGWKAYELQLKRRTNKWDRLAKAYRPVVFAGKSV